MISYINNSSNMYMRNIMHSDRDEKFIFLFISWKKRATSKTWTRTLNNLDPEKPGP